MNASLTPNETTVQTVKLLIDGEWVESQTTEWHDIVNPATQQVLAKVPFATAQEVTLRSVPPIAPSRPGS
jgi:NAD-dependent aldehyde dehydrogenases